MKGSYKIPDKFLIQWNAMMHDIGISIHDVIISNMIGKGDNPLENKICWYARRKRGDGVTEYLFDSEIEQKVEAMIKSNTYESWLNHMQSQGYEICKRF